MAPWLAGMRFKELVERYHFSLDEPFGYDIEMYRAAMVANVIANVHGNKTKINDFYPQLEPEPEKTPDQIASFFKGWCG